MMKKKTSDEKPLTRSQLSQAGLVALTAGMEEFEPDEYFKRFRNSDQHLEHLALSWLYGINYQLGHAWGLIYKTLNYVKEKELYAKPNPVSKKSYPTFKDYFIAEVKQPFEKWKELEETYHFVSENAPELFNLTFSEAQAVAVRAQNSTPAPTLSQSMTGNQNAKKEENSGSDTTAVPRKQIRDADYLTRRIARDHPRILEKMKAGEYASVRAAAIDAGIVKVLTPVQQVQRIYAKMTRQERRQVLSWIESFKD